MAGATRILTLLSPSPILRHRAHHRCSALFRLYHGIPVLFVLSHSPPLPLSSSSDAFKLRSKPYKVKCSQQHQLHTQSASSGHFASSTLSEASPPWPEWSNFLEIISSNGYFSNSQRIAADDEFVPGLNMPEDFFRAASACLLFGRDKGSLIRLMQRRDIQVLVEHVNPCIFKNGDESVSKMRTFLENYQYNEMGDNSAHTVDLMRFILSYMINFNVPSERNDLYSKQVGSSVRNLLGELAKLSYCAQQSNHSTSQQNKIPQRYGPGPSSFGQNIEMKRGDWICTRCNFMNFARNMNCLECEEARPKKQLSGGEWECPQCDFFNYSRNMVCLRCDCKRPGEQSFTASDNNVDLQRKLAENDEKAQRWFSKVSQLDNSTSDMSSAIADEDFPEIMPLRQGVNRFVTSNRKTPLEKRLASAEYRRNLDNDIHNADTSNFPDQEINRNLGGSHSRASSASESESRTTSLSNEAEKPENWFSKLEKLHNDTDEEYPDKMPVRKGENRFVASKTKDRSLSSPMNKRHVAMEQANNTANYVPFVPFPPGYFTQKDNGPSHEVESSKLMNTGAGYETTRQIPVQNNVNPQTAGTKQQLSNNTEIPIDRWSRKSFDREHVPLDNGVRYETIAQNPNQTSVNPPTAATPQQLSNNIKNSRERWSGKSLEGSAVKENDPLDMSEEAKTERWFKRVAQITDISELSQIPDEDFPSIMPMRKGVNRFVVSKRKTPLERRLTSSQYRKNLPVVRSDPIKNESDSNS